MRSLIFLVVFSIFMGFAIQGCASLKVTDPSDPNFDESQFRFEDYAEFTKFRSTMEAMFPVGTAKDKIDRILVDIGGGITYHGAQDVKINRAVEQDERIVRYIKVDKSGVVECTFRVRAVINTLDILSKKIDAAYTCK